MATLSPPDSRDFEIGDYVVGASQLPLTFAAYVQQAAPIKNQEDINSCVGHAIAAVCEINELSDAHPGETVLFDQSPGWIYRHRSESGDNGMNGREGLEIARKLGVPLQRDYPANGKKRTKEISPELYTKAANYRIKGYARVRTVAMAKECLFKFGPLYAVLPVANPGAEKFWRGKAISYHAVALYGWVESGFIVRNSWGREWDENGYGVLPWYDWPYVLEAFTLVDGPSKKVVAPPLQFEQPKEKKKKERACGCGIQ